MFLKKPAFDEVSVYLQEVERLYKFRHPHIIRLDGFLVNPKGEVMGHLTAPYAVRDNLREQFSSGASGYQKLVWVAQILDALIYLEEQKFTYLDLKRENAVVDNAGNAILIDFKDARWTEAKFLEGSPSFWVGMLVEDLQCDG